VSESDSVSLIANPLGLERNNSNTDIMDFNVPLFQKEKVLVICRVENDGQIKENKPLYIPKLDWQKDLKLSVLGPKDIKVL
jgi:pyruvate kinase